MNTVENLGTLHIIVKDLKPGDTIVQFFQLRSIETRKTRSGQDFLDMLLGDATGTVPGKMWSDAIRKWGREFDAGDFVKIEGRVEIYKELNQIIVDKIRRVELSEVPNPGILSRTGPQSPEALLDELKRYAQTLEPPELAELLGGILEENSDALMICPAAKIIHHAYKGGLVEHVVTVTRKVETILSVEPKVDRNLAIAGAILHDIGKVRELTPKGQGRTPEGRLIGHVILGMDLVRDAALQRGLADAPWLKELQHIILSHHGETQFGAPVRPLTREALLVHFIDNLDSRLKIMDEALESTDTQGFTTYNKWLEGRAFAGYQCLSKEDSNVGDSRETG
jgi:3'-5' exoribonuclease